MKKVIIYCRVSSDDQAKNFSIPHQEEVLRKYCNSRGYEVIDVIKEDHSAKTFDRPAYQKLTERIKQNKNYCDTFLFLRWDRFSRNAYEALGQIKWLTKNGIEILCHDQPIDLSGPDGKIMLAIYLMSPEIENDKIALRTIEGMRKSKREGNITGMAPVGYLNRRDEQNRPIMIVDEAKAPFIRKAFEMVGKYHTPVSEVEKFLKTNNVVRSTAYVYTLIRNIVYAGKIIVPAYKSEQQIIVQGKHQPLISLELFNQTQDILNGRTRTKTHATNKDFPLRGLLICPRCGNLLTASSSKGCKGVYYSYYHCKSKCGERTRTNIVHQAMQEVIQQIQLLPGMMNAYQTVLQDLFKTKTADLRNELQQVIEEKQRLKSALDNADDKFLSNQFTAEDYHRIKNRLTSDIQKVDVKISKLQHFTTDFDSKIRKGILAMQNLTDDYNDADSSRKRLMVSSIFPEKLQFVKNHFRTRRMNYLVS